MMTLLGIALFVVIFAMLTPGPRALLDHSLTGAGQWMGKYAPFSYLILAIVLIVPLVAAIIVMKAPPPPEPENPLAKYKNADDVLED